jgi:transposase
MRGEEARSGSLFSYVDLDARVGQNHPLRTIRAIVNEALARLAGDFSALYSRMGRPSIPPEKLLRALLLQAFYSIRSERQLMDRLEFDLLFRGSSALASTMRRGITRHFPRTASGCWKATSPPSC